MNFILRRVPTSFSWPLYEPWKGFINEYEGAAHDCPKCDGTGFSATARRLHDMWYGKVPFRPEDRGSVPLKPTDPNVKVLASRQILHNPNYYGSGEAAIEREANRLCILWNSCWCNHLNADDVAALLEADRLWEFTRDYVPGKGFVQKDNFTIPTPLQVNIWNLEGSGHDSSNCWICTKAECKRLGVSHACEHCDDGKIWPSPEVKAECEAWIRTEPPAGDSYQMWSAIEEGYPVSPVFASAEEMTAWLTANELKGD